MKQVGEEIVKVRRYTYVKTFGLSLAKLENIAKKYDLPIKWSAPDAWVCFEIPEADTEIVWFKGHDEEA